MREPTVCWQEKRELLILTPVCLLSSLSLEVKQQQQQHSQMIRRSGNNSFDMKRIHVLKSIWLLGW